MSTASDAPPPAPSPAGAHNTLPVHRSPCRRDGVSAGSSSSPEATRSHARPTTSRSAPPSTPRPTAIRTKGRTRCAAQNTPHARPRQHSRGRAPRLRAGADEAPARPALGRGPPPRGARVVHRRERAAEPVCGARGGAAVRDPLEDHLVVVDLDDLHDPRPTSRRGEPPQSGGLVAEEVGAEALGVAGRSALDPVAASAAHAATLPRAFRPSNGPASTTISAPPTTIGATVQRIP